MGAFDGETLADRFRNHFGHTDHLYGALLAGMADDWEVDGVTREIFAGWEDAPARQFPQLRMLAGLFRIVLRGDAPQLEGFYPSLGGDLDHDEAWAVGGRPHGDPRPSGATTSRPASATPASAAPTPQVSATSTPVVLVVPGTTPATTPDGTTATTRAATTDAVASSTPTPRPTRTKPGRGGPPTPKPTKPHK